jgi:multidrug efflux pump subunit AcrA (membrane-fusion protein)
VLEAMKMEHTIVAPVDGKVSAINCAVGERVAEGTDLVDLEPAAVEAKSRDDSVRATAGGDDRQPAAHGASPPKA